MIRTPGLHTRQRRGVEEIARLWRQRHVQRDEVGFGHQEFQIDEFARCVGLHSRRSRTDRRR